MDIKIERQPSRGREIKLTTYLHIDADTLITADGNASATWIEFLQDGDEVTLFLTDIKAADRLIEAATKARTLKEPA